MGANAGKVHPEDLKVRLSNHQVCKVTECVTEGRALEETKFVLMRRPTTLPVAQLEAIPASMAELYPLKLAGCGARDTLGSAAIDSQMLEKYMGD